MSKKTNNWIKVIMIIIVFAWMLVAFWFSSQPNAESTQTSGGFIKTMIDIFPTTKNLSEYEQEQLIETLQPVVRKIAHFSIYTLGGLVVFALVRHFNKDNKKTVVISAFLGLLYAISDETHQFFIDGRACQVKDVFIDFMGVLVGISVGLLLMKLLQSKKKEVFLMDNSEKRKVLMIAPKTSTFINFRGDLIKDISKKGYQVVAVCPESGFEDILAGLGARCIVTKLKKNSTTIFDNLSYLKNLVHIIKQEKPDIIFAYTIKPVIFGSIAAHMAKIKNMYSMITGLGYVYAIDNFKTKLLRIICGLGYKIAFAFNRKVIFQNVDDKQEFVKRHYLKAEKCEVVDGSGVNMQKFIKSDLPKGDITFLMVSRMLKEKGIIEYFKAAERIKKEYTNTKFLYIGAMDKVQSAISMKELQDYIDRGIVEYIEETDDVVSYLEKCSVFVLPSYYREGVPRTLLEALAVGRPIITTNTVGCKETVIQGKNGYLISPRSEDELVEKMKYMIESPEVLSKMAEESYHYCKKRFDVTIINRKMMKMMEIE